MDQMVAAIGKTHPELASVLPPTDGRPAPPGYGVDASKSEQQLGMRFIDFETSIGDAVTKLLEIKQRLDG